MKKSKTIVTLAMSILMALSLVAGIGAFGAASANSDSSTTRRTTDEFLIGGWVSYYPTTIKSFEGQTQNLARMGLNFNLYPYDWTHNPDDPKDEQIEFTEEFWKNIDTVYGKNNMYYTMSGSMNDASYNLAKNVAQQLDNCIGYNVVDEPSLSALENVGSWVKKYSAISAGKYGYVNLLPSYAGEKAIGNSYYDYLTAYVNAAGADNIEFLSHDYYAFRSTHTETGIYSDMEDMRKVAYENGKIKTYGFVQSNNWNGMRMPTIDEIRWNVYAYLTYGFKGLSYFNVVNPGVSADVGEKFSGSIIERDGTIPDQDLYDGFCALNGELKNIGTILMNLDTVHAYHTRPNSDNLEELPDNWLVAPSKASSDFIVSYMTAKDGSQPHIMLFNKSWQSTKTETFSLDKYSGITSVEYYNPAIGEYESVDITDGTINAEFAAGEGKLYRLGGEVSVPGELEAPVVDLDSGSYLGDRTVAVSVPNEHDDIYYTLDGSYPTKEDNKYTAPISLTAEAGEKNTYCLRAIAIRGNSFSEVTERTYVIASEDFGTDIGGVSADKISAGEKWSSDGSVIRYGSVEEDDGEDTTAIKYTGAEAYSNGILYLTNEDDADATPTEIWTASGDKITKGTWAGFKRTLFMNFNGTNASVTVDCGEGFGIIELYVDGVRKVSFDCSSQKQAETLTVWADEAGQHVLKIIVPSTNATNLTVSISEVAYSSKPIPEDSKFTETSYTGAKAYSDGILYLTNEDDADATPTEVWNIDGDGCNKSGWTGFKRTLFMNFTGTNAHVNVECGADKGIVELYVDGKLSTSFDCSSKTGNETLTAWADSDGDHVLKIIFSGVNASGKWMVITEVGYSDKAIPQEPELEYTQMTAVEALTEELLEYLDEPWVASGGALTKGGWAGFARELQFTFTGTGVSVNVQGGADKGYLEFYLDGVKQSGTYDPALYNGGKELYTIDGLTKGEHVLKIVLPGYDGVTGKSAQINSFRIFDRALNTYVYNEQISDSFVLSGDFTLDSGNAGFVLQNEDDRYIVSVNSDGMLFVSSQEKILYAKYLPSVITDFDADSFALSLGVYNGVIAVSVNRENVAQTACKRGSYTVGIFGGISAYLTVQNAIVADLVPGTINKEAVVVGFIQMETVVLAPDTSYEGALTQLPRQVTFELSDGSTVTANVSWTARDYDVTAVGNVRFIATADNAFTAENPFEVTAYIYVYICEDVDFTDIDAMIALAQSLKEKDYSSSTWKEMTEYLEIAKAVRSDRKTSTQAVGVATWQLEEKINALVNTSIDWSALDNLIASAEEKVAENYTEESFAKLTDALTEVKGVKRTGIITQKVADDAVVKLTTAVNGLVAVKDAQIELASWLSAAEEAIASGKYTEESVATLQSAVNKAKELTGKHTEAEINTVKNELQTAYDALTEKPSGSSDKDKETVGGCGSNVGATGKYVGLLLLGFVAAVIAKRARKA